MFPHHPLTTLFAITGLELCPRDREIFAYWGLAKVVNLTSWTTGQFLLMSRKVISHLYSPSSVVRIGSMVSFASWFKVF